MLKNSSARARKRLRDISIKMACATITLSASALVMGQTSAADPDGANPHPPNPHPPPPQSQAEIDYPIQPLTPSPEVIRPLPVFTPHPSDWRPSFPHPYDKVRGRVTDVDITAEREVCQWYNNQYDDLYQQLDIFEFSRLTQNGPGVINFAGSDTDYSIGNIQQQADILTTNIDQAVAFLAPRVQSFTQDHDDGGDGYYPLDASKSFYLLWQHLSNVSNGIKSHQPAWFVGPSVQRVKRNGSVIERSHVCDY